MDTIMAPSMVSKKVVRKAEMMVETKDWKVVTMVERMA